MKHPTTQDTPQENTSPKTEAETPARPKRPEGRFRKVLRVMAYASVVCGVAGFLAARSAYGSMQDGALEIGAELGTLGDIGAKQPIVLNGQPVHVGSMVTDLSLSETLDRAEAICDGTATADDGRDAHAVPDQDNLLLDAGEGKRGMGKVRQERDDRGVVLCFVPAEGQPEVDGIRDRMGRWMKFFASGQLEEVGRLRYFFAKKTDTGRTHLVRVWTEGAFNFYAMSNAEGGDAAGSDPSDMPRPPDSRRLLSATMEKTVYASHVYQTSLTPSQVAAHYDAVMPDRGWKKKVWDGDTRVYTRHDVSVFVTPSERDGRSLVSLLHMGYDPAVAQNGQ